ncbi:MAG: alpha-ketoacid dehydrogenase subunit beta [Candidatus Nanoarchaeia archaeon]|jgi:pyruvate dehydrogenase E1 component beta subunit|nr:alpha-ketoacid dehydrogenase subunit beta [Candidatus Nanoarchaeia archaeon]|tara:strand:+ start:8389 stop:9351 length:963 start_codon:yes stop_codon:yes gene_type:complete
MKANLVQAINMALSQEMEKDKSIVLLGEDVGIDGGVFRVTEGLFQKYKDRVFDTPLAESGIVGSSIGLALNGLKPIPEIQFEGFLMPALDQIISHASRIRNRSRGMFNVPLVVRSPFGGGIKALEHHSDSPETYFIHTPGLKVVIPSRPYDAKGLLISAIRDPDPVIFFEPKKIYRAFKEEVPEKEYTIPLGKANIIKQGEDLTIITYGSWVRETLKAIKDSKYNIEVIDLRTLKPLDTKAILNSVSRTGRCIIVHEAPKTLGLASEIIALINEKELLSLEAPIQRVTGYDIVVPLPKLEKYYMPNIDRIKKAIDKVMSF